MMNSVAKTTNMGKNILLLSILLSLSFATTYSYGSGRPADASKGVNNEETLVNQYVKALGTSIISFDASNIKQFWVEKSVLSKDGSITIELKKDKEFFISDSLKIQLANVNEALDCKVTILSNGSNADFSVSNKANKVRSSSGNQDDFINYRVSSAQFHLEDTKDFSFFLSFKSKDPDPVSIKKIILSFHKNLGSSFLNTPGKINVSKDDVILSNRAEFGNGDFVLKGARSQMYLNKNILVSDNSIQTSVTIKNIGDSPTIVYVGFNTFTGNQTRLDDRNYPFRNKNTILHVVSYEEGSDKIIVDSYPDWTKYCYLALNVKDDLSDIPNLTLAEGRIMEVKQLPNDQAEITLGKPLATPLKKGDPVRVHGVSGVNLYMNTKTLQPGEEAVFNSTIQKDDTFLQYSAKSFSKGVFYVRPLIFSNSPDVEKVNMISIRDYSISY